MSAGDSVGVRADDRTDVVLVDGAVAGGFVGVGAAVGVLTITKDTGAHTVCAPAARLLAGACFARHARVN